MQRSQIECLFACVFYVLMLHLYISRKIKSNQIELRIQTMKLNWRHIIPLLLSSFMENSNNNNNKKKNRRKKTAFAQTHTRSPSHDRIRVNIVYFESTSALMSAQRKYKQIKLFVFCLCRFVSSHFFSGQIYFDIISTLNAPYDREKKIPILLQTSPILSRFRTNQMK